MFHPGKEIYRTRLAKAIQSSRRRLRPFRQNRKRLVEQFVGDLYSDEGAQRPVYINLINQTAGVYTQALSGAKPKFLINTPHSELRPFSLRFQEALNYLSEEIKLLDTLRQCVLDAFFCVGLAKVYVADAGQLEVETNVWMDPGKPFVKRISVDNWVTDMAADHPYERLFCGDAYRVPLDEVRDNEFFDKKTREAVIATTKYQGGDDERASAISSGGEIDFDELEDMVDLIDIWHTREHMMVTYSLLRTQENWDFQGGPLDIDEDWDGPERGPYHELSLLDVPDNQLPSSPAQNLRHLHDLGNSIIRKLARQVERQKEVNTFNGSGANDAQNLNKASDGEWVKVEGAGNVSVNKMGGIDQLSAAFGVQVIDMFDRAAGNLPARAGLGPTAGTLGQEEIVGQEIAQSEKTMMDNVNRFASGIGEDLGSLLWNDPTKEIEQRYTLPGTNLSIDRSWTPDMREGDITQYNFDLEFGSMQFKDPAQRFQNLTALVRDIVMPLAPFMEMQQGRVDVQAIVEDAAELLDMPRAREWVKFDQPPMLERPGPHQGGEARQSPTTTRTTVRKNVSTGGNEQARNLQRQQAYLGNGVSQGGGQ